MIGRVCLRRVCRPDSPRLSPRLRHATPRPQQANPTVFLTRSVDTGRPMILRSGQTGRTSALRWGGTSGRRSARDQGHSDGKLTTWGEVLSFTQSAVSIGESADCRLYQSILVQFSSVSGVSRRPVKVTNSRGRCGVRANLCMYRSHGYQW